MQNLTISITKTYVTARRNTADLVKMHVRPQRKSPQVQAQMYLNGEHRFGGQETQGLLSALSLPTSVPSV